MIGDNFWLNEFLCPDDEVTGGDNLWYVNDEGSEVGDVATTVDDLEVDGLAETFWDLLLLLLDFDMISCLLNESFKALKDLAYVDDEPVEVFVEFVATSMLLGVSIFM